MAALLNYVVVDRGVVASARNEAKWVILFLQRVVLNAQLPCLEGIADESAAVLACRSIADAGGGLRVADRERRARGEANIALPR